MDDLGAYILKYCTLSKMLHAIDVAYQDVTVSQYPSFALILREVGIAAS